MLSEPQKFLSSIRSQLKLDPSSEKEILCELYTHFEDRVEELEESGLTEEEAVRVASREFGPLREVADKLHEVHSTSNWPQAIMAALPHVLFAVSFAFHLWANAFWLTIIVSSVFGVVVYGWKHNKPTWFLTWLGYALIPLLMVGLLIIDKAPGQGILVTSWWLWVSVAYFLIVATLCTIILTYTWRRDWLLGLLTVLPFLSVIGWALTSHWKKGLLLDGGELLGGLESWVALSFLALAGVVIIFTRLKKRWLRVGVLLVAGLVVLTMMTAAGGGSVDLAKLVILIIVALAIILGPALLGRRLACRGSDEWADFLEIRSHK